MLHGEGLILEAEGLLNELHYGDDRAVIDWLARDKSKLDLPAITALRYLKSWADLKGVLNEQSVRAGNVGGFAKESGATGS